MGWSCDEEFLRYVMGAASMSLSLLFLSFSNLDTTVLFCSCYLFLIVATDTFLTRIPNPASLVLLLSGVYLGLSSSGVAGLLNALGGIGIGFSLLIIPYLLGGMGAGDVKALAAMGAILGPAAIFNVFLYVALIGGLIALLHCALVPQLRKRSLKLLSNLRIFAYTRDPGLFRPEPRGETQRFPYASAIAFGYFSFQGWGGFI